MVTEKVSSSLVDFWPLEVLHIERRVSDTCHLSIGEHDFDSQRRVGYAQVVIRLLTGGQFPSILS